MTEIDLWILLILTTNILGHLDLEAHEVKTVKTTLAVIEVIAIWLLFVLMMGIVEYNVNGW